MLAPAQADTRSSPGVRTEDEVVCTAGFPPSVREEGPLMFHVRSLSFSLSSHNVNWPVWSQGRLCSWAPRAARPRPAPPSAPSDLPSWVTLHILLHFPRNKCLPRNYINHISVCVQRPRHGACPSIMGTKIRSLHQASDPLLVSFTNRRSMTVSIGWHGCLPEVLTTLLVPGLPREMYKGSIDLPRLFLSIQLK